MKKKQTNACTFKNTKGPLKALRIVFFFFEVEVRPYRSFRQNITVARVDFTEIALTALINPSPPKTCHLAFNPRPPPSSLIELLVTRPPRKELTVMAATVTERDSIIFQAKLAEYAERYDEMVEAMKKVW